VFIDVAKLKFDNLLTHHYSFTVDLPQVTVGQEKIIFNEPIKVDADATLTHKDVLIEGQVVAKAQVICNCCLEQFTLDIEAPLKERFVTTGQYELLTEKEQRDENVSCYQNSKINLEPLIEQALYLALPMRAVCKENCQGLCSKCGCNLNLDKCECKDEEIDPRLAVLQQILKNQ